MSKKNTTIPEEKLVFYEKLVSTIPGLKRKGATMPYTSLNGHMFSFLDKDGRMGLRLSEKDRLEFVEKYKAEPMVQYGKVMKEYVVIHGTLLTKTKELKKYFKLGYDYVGSLKPKPTRRKK